MKCHTDTKLLLLSFPTNPNVHSNKPKNPLLYNALRLCIFLYSALCVSAVLVNIDFREMMHVTIYWGKKVTLLFHWWKTSTWMSYLITLLACFLFSAFHQYLEFCRRRFKYSTSSNSSTIAAPLLSKLGRCHQFFHPAQLATSLYFGAYSAMGYLLMLFIMSCNGGVLLAIVLGQSFGYLMFRSADL